jgi:predicted phosphate transport protein (TIGR00153 family)
MPLFKSSHNIETKIDDFFDTVAKGALVFRTGVNSYLDGDKDAFGNAMVSIDKLESQADKLSRDVESHLYSHSLIPEHRGDVLGLLENTDNMIDTIKSCISQFSVENPDVPDEYHEGYKKLAEAGGEAVEAAIVSARAFFKDVKSVKDNLYKVHHYEKEADGISDRLKRSIFNSDLDLAHKIHLRYFALNVEKVSDKAEEVADRLAIYAIKRTI